MTLVGLHRKKIPYLITKIGFQRHFRKSIFFAIVRLIFALYNSYGGIVVFGVRDKERTSGHNTNEIKIEELNNFFRTKLECEIRVYAHRSTSSVHDVDLLIVPKRAANTPPAFPRSDLGKKYAAGTVWYRRGHEVLEAESKDIAFLFSPRTISDDQNESKIASFLPPNPAFIKDFIGRIGALSVLLQWVVREDEIRKFLWGRGGSGKSTLAYEFAKIIRDFGASISLFTGDKFDRVVFLTAKERRLVSNVSRIEEINTQDFSTAEGLFYAILIACNYSSSIDFSEKSEYIEALRDLFHHENILIVIDDIDTLTNQGIDAGIDTLYKIAIRAERTIHLLYTQRNPPVSVENAIEVPGFKENSIDYQEFVKSCCEQFCVPLPNSAQFFEIWRISEGIPLIIETVIAIRKNAGSYENSFEIFLSRRGEEARNYLFEREYSSLPEDGQARHVLAAIACFARPVGNNELEAILDYGASAIADSLGRLQGIFVSTTLTQKGDTEYYVNPVTSKFVLDKLEALRFGPQIKERVKSFKAGAQQRPKDLLVLEARVDRFLVRGNADDAWSLVSSIHDPKLIENPHFRTLRAKVALRLNPRKVSEARDDFQWCVTMRHEDASAMREWWKLERELKYSDDNLIKICDSVIDGKSYADVVKYEFLSKKGSTLFYIGADLEMANLEDAFEKYTQSLFCNQRAYIGLQSYNKNIAHQFEHLRSGAFKFVQTSIRLNYDRVCADRFRELFQQGKCVVDPFYDPMQEFFRFLMQPAPNRDRGRRFNIAQNLRRDFGSGRYTFESTTNQKQFNAWLEIIFRKNSS